MMMRKLLIILLCLILSSLLVMSGCAKNKDAMTNENQVKETTREIETKDTESTKLEEEKSIVTPAGTFPIVNEKVTLTMFAPQDARVENMETNLLTTEYEEISNVRIDWQLVPSQGLAEKRNLVLASGDYPDVFIASSLSMTDQVQYGSQGVFIPLNDYIDRYTVHVKKTLEKIPMLKDQITAPDGNIYALGTNQQCFHCSFPQKMWVNTKWLNILGLSIPKNTDDLYQVLRAFKEQDPNGNGKADEIALIGASSGTGSPVGFIMNAFIYDDSGNRLVLEDGKIDVTFNKAEWKKGLEYLRMLYEEGLLDATSFTLTGDQLRQLGEKEDAQVLGVVPGLQPGSFTSLAGERHKDYDPLPPIQGSDGIQLTSWNPYGANIGTYVITSSCKYPEVAIRWVDWFYTMEGALRSRIGREGHEWAKGEEGDIGLNGEPARWKKLKPINEVQNYFWGQGPWPQQFNHSEQARGHDIYDGATGLEGRLYDASKLYEPYKPEEVVPPLWISQNNVQKLSQLQTEINDYVNESTARFITGDLDLESDWDSYLKTLESMGLEEYLQINRQAYDAKYKK